MDRGSSDISNTGIAAELFVMLNHRSPCSFGCSFARIDLKINADIAYLAQTRQL